MFVRTIDLDLVPGKEIKHIHLNQRDVISSGLQFRLWNNGTRFTIPTGATGTIEGTKRDRCAFQYKVTVSAASNIITANVTYQMTCVPGPVPTELRLKNSAGNDIGTANFILDIEPAGLIDNPDISKSELEVVVELANAQLAQIQTYLDTAISTESDIESVKTAVNGYKSQALSYMNQIASYIGTVRGYAGQAAQWASNAKNYAVQSEQYIGMAKQYAQDAKDYSEQVDKYIELSRSWAIDSTGVRVGEALDNSMYWSLMSKSYAIGGTGKRDTEASDNAMYWNNLATQYYQEISKVLAYAESWKNIIIPQFDIDLDTMILYQTNYWDQSQLQFNLTNEAVLQYELTY